MIEIMIVVVILGVLAAVAIPAFIKYIRHAKTAEAYDKLQLLFRSSVAYIDNSNEDVKRGNAGASVELRFPTSVGRTPANSCCDYPDNICFPLAAADAWDQDTWNHLDFQIDDPHHFVYSYDSTAPPNSQFTARANGDLDCDGLFSTFERAGIINVNRNVRGSRGVFRRDENE